MLLSGIIRFSIYSYEVGLDIFNGGGLTQSWLDFAVISGDLNAILLAFIATIVALFYPESMLLTHVQVLKAAKIYHISQEMAKTEETDKVGERVLFKNLSSESLLDYISHLPDEIIDRLYKTPICVSRKKASKSVLRSSGRCEKSRRIQACTSWPLARKNWWQILFSMPVYWMVEQRTPGARSPGVWRRSKFGSPGADQTMSFYLLGTDYRKPPKFC